MKTYKKFYLEHGPELEITLDGKTVRRTFPSKRRGYPDSTNYMSIRLDKDGNPYVLTKDNGRQRIDFMVATCFVHNPDKHHFVVHIDGNAGNCHRSNLRWVSANEFNRLRGRTDWGLYRQGIEVSKDGQVKIDGEICPYIDYISGMNDLNYDTACEPYIRIDNYGFKRLKVENLVVETWLPRPTEDAAKEMVILHIDGDYKNCSVSNLKWVYRDSTEYIEYANKRDDQLAAITKANRDAAGPHLVCGK